MRERPIIFSAESVKAILEGRKTQSRRVTKPQPLDSYLPDSDILKALKRIPQKTLRLRDKDNPEFIHVIPKCPYGQVGDRLWVRETWVQCSYPSPSQEIHYKASHNKALSEKWHSPIFMPRWASRVTLEITGIRVERVQEITEEDARDEGVKPFMIDAFHATYLRPFELTWDSLNAKRGFGWESNPFVWVIGFKTIDVA